MILNMYLNECSDSTMLIENLEVNSALNNINNILLSEAVDVGHVKDIKTKFLKLIEKLKNALKELWKKIKKMVEALFSKLKKKKNKVDDEEQITFEFRSRYLVTNPIRVFKNAVNLLCDIDKYILYTDPEDIFKVKYQLEELNGKGVYERLECSKDAQVYNINVRDINLDNVTNMTSDYNRLVDAIDVVYDKVKRVIQKTDKDIKYVVTHCNLILNIIDKINNVCVGTFQDYARMAKIASSKMEKAEEEKEI